ADAAGMLRAGQSPEQGKQALVARGLSPENASTVVDNLLGHGQGEGGAGTSGRSVGGGGINVIRGGPLLRDGPWAVQAVPGAGFLTILIGGAIAGSGQK